MYIYIYTLCIYSKFRYTTVFHGFQPLILIILLLLLLFNFYCVLTFAIDYYTSHARKYAHLYIHAQLKMYTQKYTYL